MLNTVRHGERARGEPPVLIVHGLFGSARNWGAIAKRLSDSREVLAVDMRNHGDSPHSADQSYAAMADDLAEVIAAAGGQADVVGHSMGGKAAMVLALGAPERVRRLVVADIAPVAYAHSQAPLVEAMRALDLRGIKTRGEADARLAQRIDSPQLRAFLLQSLDLREGPPRWKLNLDALADQMEHIMGWPEPAGRFDGPALFVSGAASDYVRPEHRDPIRALFPRARFATIPDAGHWLHAERPREFEAVLRSFLTPNP